MSFYDTGIQPPWAGLNTNGLGNDTGLTGWWHSISRLMGMSFLATMFSQQGYIVDSMRLLLLGSLVEAGRRLFQWLMERMRFQYSITAQFSEGDPAYDWIVLFLTQEKVWRRSRDFTVTAKSSKRKWGIKTGEEEFDENADYVPTYELPQLFSWGGYWIEIKRSKGSYAGPAMSSGPSASIYMTIYTWNMKAFSLLLAEARRRYIDTSRPHVNIHTLEMPGFSPGMTWTSVKRKPRRPLSSIVLEEGVIESILQDARDFIDTEDWYIEAGIPHRRGYLLYGPPGTGKSSTIYALAGELGFEIYSLSLSSGFIDDYSLQRAASSIPKHSIFLIEDIDCAFPSREEESDDEFLGPGYPPPPVPPRRSAVTLSGLLNVLDGVDSEEGKIFFATTNYVDRLDAALIRPGRIDQKVEYHLATRYQAHALFMRFFAEAHGEDTEKNPEHHKHIEQLAEKFSEGIPAEEFSTADLQGYLLLCKRKPEEAASGVEEWVQKQRDERKARAEREKKRKLKYEEAKRKGDAMRYGYYPGPMGAAPYGGGLRTPITEGTTPLPTADSSGQLQIPLPPGLGSGTGTGTAATAVTATAGVGLGVPISNDKSLEASASSSPAVDISLDVPESPDPSVDGSVVVVPSNPTTPIPASILPALQPPPIAAATSTLELPTADSVGGASSPSQVPG
ncbi:P-loop containing nucleoside triphosphate hydrolase protein [Pluteus cervinus]|uniref:P-loop containing nucleoside triphosphate hydrolase protein n=1 Tax=Pluteus cervinus TaxID=181527 RepID=A0ACD3AJD7_9AGAR|nr:P-loop containing nucleoside triphosphate hydrolase protein [Pluteus cervinus]